MTELHRCKATPGMDRAVTIDFTKGLARARAVVAAINHEGTPHPSFARASQNVATTTTLLDTLPTPSTDEVGKLYQQLKDILGVATEQQAGSSFQRRAIVSLSSPGHSKANRQRTMTEHPTAGTMSSLT
jgi:hypothetical protein